MKLGQAKFWKAELAQILEKAPHRAPDASK